MEQKTVYLGVVQACQEVIPAFYYNIPADRARADIERIARENNGRVIGLRNLVGYDSPHGDKEQRATLLEAICVLDQLMPRGEMSSFVEKVLAIGFKIGAKIE